MEINSMFQTGEKINIWRINITMLAFVKRHAREIVF